MHKAIFNELKRIATAEQITTYGAIAPLANLDMGNPDHRNQLAELLGEISKREHTAGRPLLSAVVVLEDTKVPGKGFFTLAKALDLHRGGDDLSFFAQELARVHQHWRRIASIIV